MLAPDDELREHFEETHEDGESFEEWFESGFAVDADVPEWADGELVELWRDDATGESFEEWFEHGYENAGW